MSLVKPEGNNLPSIPPPEKPSETRFEWQNETTDVARRSNFISSLFRFLFNWWRTPLIIFILAVLLDANFARTVRDATANSLEILSQTFSFGFDIQSILTLVIRIVTVIFIAIGQFALFFFFLGRARMYEIWPGGSTEGVTFKDYRGHPELLEQALQIVTLLRGVKAFEDAGGEPLNGLLLEGPPGTGKTWMAQAISTEAGIPFFYVDASSMNSMFVGIAPLKVMSLYRKARKAAKDYGASIIFIDEIDAIGSRGLNFGNNGGRDSVIPAPIEDLANRATRLVVNRLPIFFGMGNSGLLSTLLTEMDGFSSEHGFWSKQRIRFYKNVLRQKPPKPEKRILTIGATNRIQALDIALLRPGRFDKKIRVDPPDMEGRRDIFEYYLSKMAHDDTMDPVILSAETPFYTPADIKYLLNEALRYAFFTGRTHVTIEDFRRAQPEHEYGLAQPIKTMLPEDLRRIAAHEAGHAIALRIFTPHERISRITIIPQGRAYGYVQHYPAREEYDYSSTYELRMNNLRVAIGGKAAEMEYGKGEGEQTLGVGGDFMNIRYNLGLMAHAGMFGPMGTDLNAPEMVEAMENAFVTVLEEVRMILRLHRGMGEALIDLLMDKKILMAHEVEAFFDQYGLYTPKIELTARSERAAAQRGMLQ
jgi:ATP-dependent Zn protease